MQNTDIQSIYDDACKYISHSRAIVTLISNENAFKNINPIIIENALWSVTENLAKLDQLFDSVLDVENSAARKP